MGVNEQGELTATAVLEVSGMLRASEKIVVEAVLGRRPGVLAVQANPVAQTATVTFATRFLVAVGFSVPVVLWSPIGRDVLGFDVAAPFGLRDDVFALLLSLPVIFPCSPVTTRRPHGESRASPASPRSSPRCCPRTSPPKWGSCRGSGAGLPWSATASTTRRPLRRPTSASCSSRRSGWCCARRSQLSMSGSSLLVAVNALLLKRLRLHRHYAGEA
jgi:hypothetical protein